MGSSIDDLEGVIMVSDDLQQMNAELVVLTDEELDRVAGGVSPLLATHDAEMHLVQPTPGQTRHYELLTSRAISRIVEQPYICKG